MTKKKKRFSIRTKILVVIIALNLLIILAYTTLVYLRATSEFEKIASSNALSLAEVAAPQINGNLLNLIDVNSTESYAYQVLLDSLKTIHAHVEADSIYIIVERNGEYIYMISSNGDQIDTVEDIYHDEVSTAMSGQSYGCEKIESYKGKNIISAYSPIYDNNGNLTGVLGVDCNADVILETSASMVWSMYILGGILLVISLGLSFGLSKEIVLGLNKVNHKLEDLVSNDGDLTQSISVNSNDEVSDIAGNINQLLDYIRSVVVNISNSTVTLSKSVTVALDTTTETTQEISSVNDTTSQMSAAMEETSASIQQVEGYVDHIQSDVDSMHDNVKKGTEFASQMKQRADHLRTDSEKESALATNSVEDMTQKLNEKIEKAKDVESINTLTSTILDIASQTNLLALNASIEAARAGEHGRGFAVVAEEISNLAANSAETAKQIQVISHSVIGSVDDLTHEATNMIQFIKEKTIGSFDQMMHTGAQYAEDAIALSDMLDEIENASANIDHSMNSVNTTIKDVAYAIEESTNGINRVAEAVGNMAVNMQKNQDIVYENSEISKQLDVEVHKFKYE